jgi:hypothetical protein
MAVAYILASDSILGLMEEGVAVTDDSIIKVGYLDGFTCWDYTRV